MINNLPSGWKEEKIGNIISLTIGKTPSRKKSEYFTGDNLWVSIADIKSINLENTKEKITEEAIKDSKIKKVKAGTLLMSYKLSIGKMAFASQDLYTNEAIAALNIDIEDLDKKFLYYYLLNADLEKTTDRAVKGKTLNKSKIEQIPIQYPPLQQQEKIVKVLDITSNLIEKQKELLEKYDLFLKSKFIEMFGCPIKNPMEWEVVKLENYTNLVSSGSTPKGGQSVYLDSGEIRFIRSQNVRMNEMDYEGIYYISEEIYNKMKRTQVQYNDVLLNITGASIGRTAIYKDTIRANVNQHVCIIRLKDTMNSIFLNYFIGSDSFQNRILSNQSGATREALNFTQIKNFKISYPPIDLQNKFASIVEKIETIKEKENKKLKQLEDLHNSLMQKAFKGEIE